MTHRSEQTTQGLMGTPEFYEEMLLLNAQELVAQLMQDRDVSKADLARKLKKTKAHITSLLSDGRNLTLKSLARICYHLGSEVKLATQAFEPVIQNNESSSYLENKIGAVNTAPSFNRDYFPTHCSNQYVH